MYRYKMECKRCKRTIGYISLPYTAIDNNYTITRISVNNNYAEPILCPSCEEKPQGEWIVSGYIDTCRGYVAKCPFCKEDTVGGGNFCKHCGADMRKGVMNNANRHGSMDQGEQP